MVAWGVDTSLKLQAQTPMGGVALINGTPSILQWTVPNDGQLHRFTYFSAMTISSPETGGTVNVLFTAPDGSAQAFTVFSGGQGSGQNFSQTFVGFMCKGGTTVTIIQIAALTAGAAIMWAEIWGS